jgi:hypothetical protein
MMVRQVTMILVQHQDLPITMGIALDLSSRKTRMQRMVIQAVSLHLVLAPATVEPDEALYEVDDFFVADYSIHEL